MALGTLSSDWSLWPEGRGIKARFFPYRLVFHRAAGTSRGQMLERLVHFIELTDSEGVVGSGRMRPTSRLESRRPSGSDDPLVLLMSTVQRGRMGCLA
ncbi:MAG: hypothetical protein RLZZ335_225 [Bacteroidota bacterium]